MPMTTEELKADLLARAGRKTIYANVEARLLGEDLARVQRAIAALQKARLIYKSDRNGAHFWGASFDGYRANR